MYWKTFNIFITGPLKFHVLKIKFHSEDLVASSITQQCVYKLDRTDMVWRRKMLRCRAPTNTETNNKWPQRNIPYLHTPELPNRLFCYRRMDLGEGFLRRKVVIHECVHVWFGGEIGHGIQSFMYTKLAHHWAVPSPWRMHVVRTWVQLHRSMYLCYLFRPNQHTANILPISEDPNMNSSSYVLQKILYVNAKFKILIFVIS